MRVRLLWVLGLSSLLAGCGDSATADRIPSPEPAAAAPEAGSDPASAPEPTTIVEIVPAPRPTEADAYVGTHVLVPDGTRLRHGPSATAEFVTLELDHDGAGLPPSRPFVVTAARDGFLALHAPDSATRCGPGLSLLDEFDLEVWVLPQELAPVLHRSRELSYRDGTRITLHPGVAVGTQGSASSDVEIDAGRLRLRVPVAAADVGTWFLPPRPNPLSGTPTELARGLALTYDGDHVLPTEGLTLAGESPAVFAESRIAGLPYVRVGTPCAIIEARTRAAEVRAEDLRAAALRAAAPLPGTLTTMLRGSWRVTAGTEVRWEDGTPAGTVRSEFVSTTAPTRIGGSDCVAHPLDAAAASSERVVLCFAHKHVQMDDSLALALGSGIGPLALGAVGSGPAVEALLGEDAFGDVGETDLLSGAKMGEGGELDLPSALGRTGSGLGGGGAPVFPHDVERHAKRATKASFGVLEIDGDLSRESVRKVISARLPAVRRCHATGVSIDESAVGALELTLRIDVMGTVTSTDGTFSDAPVLACVESTAKQWRFPSADGGTVVTIPYTLELAAP